MGQLVHGYVEGIEREAAAAERNGSPNAGAGGEGPSGSGGGGATDLPDLDNPPEYYQYRLVGVVVHSGTAFAGHYSSYMREREAPPGAALGGGGGGGGGGGKAAIGERWHVYDDQRVEPYDISSLEPDAFGGKYTVNVAGLGGGGNDEDGEGGGNNGSGGNKGRVTEHDRPNSAYMLFYERVKAADEVVPPPSRAATPALGAAAAAAGKTSEEMSVVAPSPRSAAAAAAVMPAPAMPQKVRSEVMTQNLQFVFNGNLFSREYFAFIQQLVDSTLQGIARKAQRRGPEGGPSRHMGTGGMGMSMSAASPGQLMMGPGGGHGGAVQVEFIETRKLESAWFQPLNL
jgi:hypothetical protein